MPRRDHHSPKIPIIDHHPRQRPAIAIEALPIDHLDDRRTADHRSSKCPRRFAAPLL